MNRIECMIHQLERKRDKQEGNEGWIRVYKEQKNKQIKFLKWLLQNTKEEPIYEIHEKSVIPSVFGMGDVSHSVSIQLNTIKTPARPVILVFDYDMER